MEQATPYDSQIEELKTKIERLRLEMETVSREFIESAVVPVQTWYKVRIETSVKNDPEHLATLNAEQVRLMKANLQQLIDRAPEIVRANLDRNSCWTHRSPVDLEKRYTPQSTYEYKHQPSSSASPSEARDEAFRRIMGETGPLLINHAFVKSKQDYKGAHLSTMTYYGQFPYSDEMKSLIQKYGLHSKPYIEAHEQLHQTERDRLQHQANNLWDSN